MFKYRLSFVRLSNEPDRYVNELSRIAVGGSIGLLAFQATCLFFAGPKNWKTEKLALWNSGAQLRRFSGFQVRSRRCLGGFRSKRPRRWGRTSRRAPGRCGLGAPGGRAGPPMGGASAGARHARRSGFEHFGVGSTRRPELRPFAWENARTHRNGRSAVDANRSQPRWISPAHVRGQTRAASASGRHTAVQRIDPTRAQGKRMRSGRR
jgi:hypothetical protein